MMQGCVIAIFFAPCAQALRSDRSAIFAAILRFDYPLIIHA